MINLYNTLTRKKEPLRPIIHNQIRFYACGPTVYDRPHIGNARSAVVYDLLFRLLRHIYGAEQVVYVRNITDVDDKINAAAKLRNIPISELTTEITGYFHADLDALNVLRPTHEPRATQYIEQMIAMIEKLIANKHAYIVDANSKDAGHVLFDVSSDPDYGILSGRSVDELIAGARVEVAEYKKNPADFILWKPAAKDDDASSIFQSPWGAGRPGWHIECSAMSTDLLGEEFDLHGGGADLMFPHHENEIAQSCCANPGSKFAKMWVHNGFLTVNGEKMSKSLGNFTTVKELLDKGINGEVIRLCLLSSHYRKPLDWTDKLIDDSKKQLDTFYRIIQNNEQTEIDTSELVHSLSDDLNVPEALALLHRAPKNSLKALGKILGILQQEPEKWFKSGADDSAIQTQIAARQTAKLAKNWAEADRIRNELKRQGILLEDKPDGSTDWRAE